MIDFGLKQKNGELYVTTSLVVPDKINKEKSHTKWKLIESLFDSEGVEYLFVTEPKQRNKKIEITEKDIDYKTLISPTGNITLVELLRNHDIETLLPQISLAIQKLNQLYRLK